MSFSDIIGQSRAIGLLRQAMKRDQMPHAYLFTGIRGVGKTSTARAMAMHLNCTAPIEEKGCGRCAPCRQILGGNHPDLLFIQPEGANIKIDQVRGLNRKLAFAPVSAPYRISVVRRAQAMTEEAANAFLKTLEEPPPGNILILQAVEPGDLLPTIVSRCQRIAFQPLDSREIAAWLTQHHQTDPEAAGVAAAICGGSLGMALKMVTGPFLEKRRNWLLQLIDMLSKPVDAVFTLAAECAAEDAKVRLENSGDNLPGLQDLLSVWESWYRDLLLARTGAPESLLINRDFSRQLKKIAERFKIVDLIDGIFRLDRARRDILKNRNTGLVLTHLIFGLRRISAAP